MSLDGGLPPSYWMPGDYRKLKAYDLAKNFAVSCARTAAEFPAYEQRALADQLRRAAYSVVLNIAEGSSRSSLADSRRLLDFAGTSLHESRVIIEIAGDLGYIRPEAVAGLLAQCDETGRTLFGYMKLVESRLAALRRRTAVATGVALAVVLLLF